ncbi:Neuferricin [Halocaridina rubra]|uniref:Neuferricin n=1 Tax=Halocaridina rubra TaxID=373956 RepID=A0AAN9AD33_HALRR
MTLPFLNKRTFAGCDASRAFVTGEFTEEGLTDDIRGLSATDYVGLDDWLKFYRNDYKYVGKLIGRYYDENGMPTHYQGEAQKWIAEAFQQKDDENLEKKMFPPCNSEWTSSSGSRLWCTKRSGGVDRDWVGVPRKLYSPGQSKPRCACIKTSGPPSYDPQRKIHNDRGDLEYPNLEEYAGCRQDDTECFIVDD